jgi:hypothetical protein
MTTAPDSIAGWLTSQCGLKLNPALSLGVPDQPKWLVLDENDEVIGTAQNLKAGTALIDAYIAKELKQRGRNAEQFLETIND